jgi:hypothetical protein
MLQKKLQEGASIVKWTKKVLWYTETMIFLVKRAPISGSAQNVVKNFTFS